MRAAEASMKLLLLLKVLLESIAGLPCETSDGFLIW